jgi:hypothetical protein
LWWWKAKAMEVVEKQINVLHIYTDSIMVKIYDTQVSKEDNDARIVKTCRTTCQGIRSFRSTV